MRQTTIQINADPDLSQRFHDIKDKSMKRLDKSQLGNDEFLQLLLEVFRYHLNEELGEQ